MMRRTQELIIFGILIWFTVLIYMFHSQGPTELNNTERVEIDKVIFAMEQLQKQNQQLMEMESLLRKLKLGNESTSLGASDSASLRKLQMRLQACLQSSQFAVEEHNAGSLGGVSQKHEVLVKRINNDIVEMGYNLERELKLLKENPSNLDSNVNDLITRFTTQQHAALIDVEDLSSLNDEWRRNEAKELQDLIQSRLQFVQNPKNCDDARQLQCKLNKGCGFGCQIHHVAYCFMVAYGTKRTLILESKNWRYNPEGWEAVFQPVSETCVKPASSVVKWNGEEATKNDQAVFLPIVDGVVNPPPYLPLGIPEDISTRLLRLHGNPSVWWIGQFMRYLMRPQAWLQKDLDTVEKASGFQQPVVGVHVRRTDKVGTEAAFHGIEEYMKHVIAWYDKLDLRLSKKKEKKAIRRVYLASDDPSVLPEARKKYPDYVFFGDTKIADSAGLGNRYNKNSLRGVLIDIYMLSKCNFLSCTFSSQVCRVAYELMQTLHPDAASYFHSLDDIYYYGGQTGHEQVAVYPHKGGSDVMDLEVGDVIGIAGNHWDGYSKGNNRRTGKTGLYPSYKMEEIYRKAKYPIYSEMNKDGRNS